MLEHVKPHEEAATPLQRRNCFPLLSSAPSEWERSRDESEALPAVFNGCGTNALQAKYTVGPMSPTGTNASEDVFGVGSSATPTPEAYRAVLEQAKTVLSEDLHLWEVWNEADSPQFYRGTPQDLVDLTFVAGEVFGRERVIAPSFTPSAVVRPRMASGAWNDDGRRLSRGEFLTEYWQLLEKETRERGVDLPVSVANIHGYGTGTSVEEAAGERETVLREFKAFTTGYRKRHGLALWDTEWNLRAASSDDLSGDSMVGAPDFQDSPENAEIWAASSRDAACLGYREQFTYLWTDSPSTSGFESGQLQLNQETPYLNKAFQNTHGSRVACENGQADSRGE